MSKKKYAVKEIEQSNGHTLYLKHRNLLTGLGKSDQVAAAQLLVEARAAVGHAIARLCMNLPHALEKRAVEHMFRTTRRMDLDYIQSTLELIQNGLALDITLNLTVNEGKARQMWGGDPTHVKGYAGYSPDKIKKDVIHVRGRIVNKIASNDFTDREDALRTFVHEASHKLAGTTDEFYLQWTNGGDWIYTDARVVHGGAPVHVANPPKARLLNNADSYGWLAAQLYLMNKAGVLR